MALLLGLGSAAALSAPRTAHAYAVAVSQPGAKTFTRWTSGKIKYYLNPICSPDLPQATCLDQLRKGFDGWEAATCTSLEFSEGYHCNTALGQCLFDKGKSCSTDADCPAAVNTKVLPMGYNQNGRNELVFVESGWPHGKYVLGVTSPLFYTNGTIIESDIAFNGQDYKWVANPASIGGSLMDLLSVAIHEQGHFFGVQHMLPGYFSNSDPPTMAPSVDPFGKSATLTADDLKAACFLNPKEASYTCSSDADCPYINETDSSGEEYFAGKLTCQNGTCGWGSGGTTAPKGELGAGCTSNNNCKTGLFCQYYGNEGFCSQQCKPSAQNCPSGFVCLGYQGGGDTGACIPGEDEPQPTKGAGESCTSSAECTSLLCIEKVCRTKCTPSSPTACTSKEECAKLVGVSYGACVPKPESTLKDNGEACFDASECITGVCLKAALADNFGYCRQPCTGKGTCPGGQACVEQIDGSLACLPGTEKNPAGSSCAGPNDCETGLCIAYGASNFCSKSCDLGYSDSCPCGMSCQASTAGNLCIPGAKVACVSTGGSCAASSECAGGVCEGGKCLAGCSVVQGNACQSGEACARLAADTTQGLCLTKGKTPLGELCDNDASCDSLFCAPGVDTQKRCGQPCDPKSDQCGPGFGCSAIGSALGMCVLLPPGADTTGGGVAPTGTVESGADGGCSAGSSGGMSGLGAAVLALVAVLGRRRWRA